MKTILITAIGGDIAQSVAAIIREEKPNFRMLGVDMDDRHGGSLFVDQFCKIPSAQDSTYVSSLKSIIKKENVNIMLPMSETEISVLQPSQSEFQNLQWITAGNEIVNLGLDKLLTARKIAELGLPVPWTINADEDLPKEYPCIVKSRFGSGSRTVYAVSNKEDAIHLKGRVKNAIFQELLLPEDQEITCAVYRTIDGRVTVLQMLRRLTGGFTGWAKVMDDPEIRDMCESIAVAFHLTGSMNVQLRRTLKGPRIFEINPRFSSTVLMRHRLGFKDVIWTLDELEGKGIRFSKIKEGAVMVRVQNAEVVL